MENLIKQYAEKTGARETRYVADFEKYGSIWEICYGAVLENGIIEPTGPPVLAYVKDGKVAVLTGEDAFYLLSLLDKQL